MLKLKIKKTKELTVTLTPEFQLEQALKQEDPALVRKLTVAGMLTKDDFRYIRNNMAETLQELDMSNASIEGNEIECDGLGDCFALTSVSIPASVLEIEDWLYVPYYLVNMDPFQKQCSPSITAHPDNPVYASEDGVLFNKDKTKLIHCPQGRRGDYVIPDTVVEIGKFAFGYCGLNSVIVPKSVKIIGERVFMGFGKTTIVIHPENSSYIIENGILFSKDKTELVYYPAHLQDTDYAIPEKVVKIGIHAFFKCYFLKSITISDSVTEIGKFAFWGCERVKSVFIPASVTKIGVGAFLWCDVIEAHPDNPAYMVENGVLFNRDKSELICYPDQLQGNDYKIPDTVVKIGEYAFYFSQLTSITIPDSVVVIGRHAFRGSKLQFIDIPCSVIEIGYAAFRGCFYLSSVYIPDSVKIIEDWAFSESILTSVTIPKSVIKIGENAFQYDFIWDYAYPHFNVHPDNPVYASENGELIIKE